MTQNGGKGFRRDYDLGTQRIADEQAGHNSFTAGNHYARLASMAPGWVESSRAEYCQISKRWHEVLGIGTFLEPIIEEGNASSSLKRKLLYWDKDGRPSTDEPTKKRIRVNGRLCEQEEVGESRKMSSELEEEMENKAVNNIRRNLLASQFLSCITKP